MNPLGSPVEVALAVWEWGAYLGKEAPEHGIDTGVASWQRPVPHAAPTMAKAGGNCLNSRLIKLEALAAGYAEGIALDCFGHLSGGSGENIFLVRDMTVFTPPISSEEVLVTGTAAEITPVRSVDRRPVGDGRQGPLTKEIQKRFFDVISDGNDKHHWLTFLGD